MVTERTIPPGSGEIRAPVDSLRMESAYYGAWVVKTRRNIRHTA